jgi:hypothetical protein
MAWRRMSGIGAVAAAGGVLWLAGDSVYIFAARVGLRLAAGASSAVALWQNAETNIYVRPIAVP